MKSANLVGVTAMEHAFGIESSAGTVDDSVIIVGDNKHCCAGRRRVRQRWRGGTRLPPPAVLQNQHKTETIEPLCSTLEEANCVNAFFDCADLALVLSQVHYVLWSFCISDTCGNSFCWTICIECTKCFTGHTHILEDRPA